MTPSPSELVTSWTRVSEYAFVHTSGARIERRGFPVAAGWFLTPAEPGQPSQRFEPTFHGCDQAFIAFAGRAAAAEALARILTS